MSVGFPIHSSTLLTLRPGKGELLGLLRATDDIFLHSRQRVSSHVSGGESSGEAEPGQNFREKVKNRGNHYFVKLVSIKNKYIAKFPKTDNLY